MTTTQAKPTTQPAADPQVWNWCLYCKGRLPDDLELPSQCAACGRELKVWRTVFERWRDRKVKLEEAGVSFAERYPEVTEAMLDEYTANGPGAAFARRALKGFGIAPEPYVDAVGGAVELPGTPPL